MSGSAYARLVPKIHRSKKLPKIDRPWRPRMIAWAGPSAFYPNRFYEQDKWYKARVDKPEKIPKLHIIEPTNHAHSLAELLEKEKLATEVVNIGFKKAEPASVARSDEELSVLERKARKMELTVDTSLLSTGNDLAIFHHFNIFSDLFGQGVYFESVQKFDVVFEDQEVFTGNVIEPTSTKAAPQVSIAGVGKGGYTTLLMVSIDGNAFEKEGQLVHWMVSNIPDGGEVSQGNEVVPYLQALPFYGSGYHRVAFVLFRHQTPLEHTVEQGDISSRAMSVAKFYKQNEKLLTPSGIRFFQTSYDNSVKEKLHELGLKSPQFEYEYTPALKPEQKEFPQKAQPFDLYLDMYRDPKEVEAELLEERLKRAQLDDFQAPKWLDPNYNENKRNLPAWQHRRILAREGRFSALYNNSL